MSIQPLNRSDRLQPRPRVDFVLAHHRGLATKAFDDGADVGPNAGAGEQDRCVAGLGGALKRLAHATDEILEFGRCQGQLLFLALAHQRVGEGILPVSGQRDDRQSPILAAMRVAKSFQVAWYYINPARRE